ncbi:MAG TPA: GtrA family protein [Jatrophihabitans sp.]
MPPEQARAEQPRRRLAARLGLDRHLLAYLVINSCTFGLDVGLLTLLHGGWHWPLALAISTAYVLAFATSYVLNRRLNFRSHAPIGRQVRVYAVVVTVNYLLWILGFSDVLAAAGVEYQLARLAAGACEAVYMYFALRWIVFREAAEYLADA